MSEEEEDEERDRNRRSVFLGNLPFDAQEEQLWTLFGKGVSGGVECIENVRLVRDRSTNRGKVSLVLTEIHNTISLSFNIFCFL